MNDIFSKKLDKLIDEAMLLAVEKVSADIPEPVEKHKFSKQHELAMENMFSKRRQKTWFRGYSKYIAQAAAVLLFIAVAATVTTLDLPSIERDTDYGDPQPQVEVYMLPSGEGVEYDNIFFADDDDRMVVQSRQYGAGLRQQARTFEDAAPIQRGGGVDEMRRNVENMLEREAADNDAMSGMQMLSTRIAPDESALASAHDAMPAPMSIDIEVVNFGDLVDWRMEPVFGREVVGGGISTAEVAAQRAVMIDHTNFVGGVYLGFVPQGFTLQQSSVFGGQVFAMYMRDNLYFTVRAGEPSSEITISGNIDNWTLSQIQGNAAWE